MGVEELNDQNDGIVEWERIEEKDGIAFALMSLKTDNPEVKNARDKDGPLGENLHPRRCVELGPRFSDGDHGHSRGGRAFPPVVRPGRGKFHRPHRTAEKLRQCRTANSALIP
jgi:hypothetical protein